MITAEQIANANKSIKATPIKGKDYAEVSERIKAFRQICPNGSIQTDILSLENGVVTMKTTIYDEEGKILATGLAQEKESSSYINKTSYIENCETSSVGRALGMCGLGVDGSIASALEVANAIENQNESPKKTQARQQNKSTQQVNEEVANKQMADSVDKNLIPEANAKVTQEQLDMIKAEMERTGINQHTILVFAKAKSLEEINQTTAVAIINNFKKTPDKQG